VHAVRGIMTAPSVGQVVVAVPSAEVASVRELLRTEASGSVAILVVAGGHDRTESVARALGVVDESVWIVLVHDAARALAPPDLVERVISAVSAGADAVVPVLPVTDTIKLLAPDGRVTGTLDRGSLGAVQTPQGFRRAVLVRAHEMMHTLDESTAEDAAPVTDDAALVERIGIEVRAVAGSEEAFKVTRPLDVLLAEAVLERRATGGGQ
jgi:2-C-methyl-D-erythritol 4-phosphate cytidylyltransferase